MLSLNFENKTCTVSLLELSSGEKLEDQSSKDSDDGDDNKYAERELSDATLKMLRLLANLCINEVPGTAMSNRHSVLELLQNLLEVSSSSPDYEELLLNAVATCTNIGFFACRNVSPNRITHASI